ncbi:MAG: Mth938-like domain-containing protein [Desulfobacterales bacterium]
MIEDYTQGRIRIDGKSYDEDIKIIEKKVKPHWWRREGHRLEKADIGDVFKARPDILVVGTGYAQQMKVSEDVLSHARDNGMRVISESTPSAVKTFNRILAEGGEVAGVFHLTC